MSNSSPDLEELGTLVVRRLNRAAVDLGLAPQSQDLFTLESFTFDLDAEDAAAVNLEVGPIDVFDVGMTLDEIEEWSDLATRMEQLAERIADLQRRANEPKPPADPNQMRLPGFGQD